MIASFQMKYECETPQYAEKEFETTCKNDGTWDVLLKDMNCKGKEKLNKSIHKSIIKVD